MNQKLSKENLISCIKVYLCRVVDDIVDLLRVTFQDGRHLLRILVEHHSVSVCSSCELPICMKFSDSTFGTLIIDATFTCILLLHIANFMRFSDLDGSELKYLGNPDICSGDNCSCDDISNNKELKWG